jgi:dolichol-phosphate mannosyltransferase
VTAEISIVVPVYNEVDNVLPLAAEVAAALDSSCRAFELVFVDDGSTDGTWKAILHASRADPRVRGIRHLRNAGQSAALWTGISASTAAVIGTLDGDLQNDPADLPRLLERLDQYDFVCGVRTKRQDSLVRRISSSIARRARKWVLRVDFADTGCALRVFKRSALQGVFPFHGLHRFLPILVQGGGSRTLEVPIHHRPRIAGVSKYGVWNRLGRGIVDLFAIAWYQRRRVHVVPIEESERGIMEARPGLVPVEEKKE